MDMVVFIFDVGWVFFVAWGTALVAVGVVAFGRDVRAFTDQATGERERPCPHS